MRNDHRQLTAIIGDAVGHSSSRIGGHPQLASFQEDDSSLPFLLKLLLNDVVQGLLLAVDNERDNITTLGADLQDLLSIELEVFL